MRVKYIRSGTWADPDVPKDSFCETGVKGQVSEVRDAMGARLCSPEVKAAVPTEDEVTDFEQEAAEAAKADRAAKTGPVEKAEAPPTKKAKAKKEK